MMGVQDAPVRLFYDFDLEAHVPILSQIFGQAASLQPLDTVNRNRKRLFKGLPVRQA